MKLESYDAQCFARDAAARFPAWAEQFEEDPELLHVHMATLALIVREALSAGDVETIQDVGSFLEEALLHPRAISEIANAVAISFIDARELRESDYGETALRDLPERVRDILLEQERRDLGSL